LHGVQWLLVLLICSMMVTVACATQADDSNIDKGVSEVDALAYDYSAIVSTCEFSTFDTLSDELSGFDRTYLSQMEKRVGSCIPSLSELTDKDKNRLGVWYLPNESATFLAATIVRIGKYYRSYGDYPENGLELFPELTTQEGLAELATLSDEDVLSRYRDGIDTITGRFYKSFRSAEWEAGSMMVQVITDPEIINSRFPDVRMYIDSTDPSAGKRSLTTIIDVIIYGEEPGSVVYEGAWMQ